MLAAVDPNLTGKLGAALNAGATIVVTAMLSDGHDISIRALFLLRSAQLRDEDLLVPDLSF